MGSRWGCVPATGRDATLDIRITTPTGIATILLVEIFIRTTPNGSRSDLAPPNARYSAPFSKPLLPPTCRRPDATADLTNSALAGQTVSTVCSQLHQCHTSKCQRHAAHQPLWSRQVRQTNRKAPQVHPSPRAIWPRRPDYPACFSKTAFGSNWSWRSPSAQQLLKF
jgi:hypothetical protein